MVNSIPKKLLIRPQHQKEQNWGKVKTEIYIHWGFPEGTLEQSLDTRKGTDPQVN
jgi:hypothetical protein